MITLGFYAALARLHAGDLDARITHVGFGDDGTAAVETDTGLSNAYTKPLDGVTVDAESPRALRFGWSLDPSDAVGLSIREIGLLTEDGQLVVRVVRAAAIEKTDDLALGDWIEIQL